MKKERSITRWFTVSALLLFLSVSGCQRAYYGALEKVGIHKRDILVEGVEKAKDAQQAAKEQFDSALDRFTAVLNFNGGELAEKYETLKTELDRSEERAQAVHDRIDAVESVADALFEEWKAELDQYTRADLRRSSARKLAETQRLYNRLMGAMLRAEKKIGPVLDAFRDQVLFLKHNLNAQAVASLQGELASVESDVAALIEELETAIAEAESFIESMR